MPALGLQPFTVWGWKLDAVLGITVACCWVLKSTTPNELGFAVCCCSDISFSHFLS